MLSIAYVIALAASATVPTAAVEQGSVPVAKPAKEKKICRRDVATGSIMPRSVCRTRAEWDALTAQGQTDLDRARDDQQSRAMVGGNR
jgi:hypothetical protein